MVLRLLAARSVATSLTVVAALTVAATLAGVVVIALEMFISRKDLDVLPAVVAIAGIAGFAVGLLLGRRVSAASRLMLAAVQEVGRGGGYCRPTAVLPAELAGLSAELETPGIATVSVSDSCGGIPAEHLARVFDVGFVARPSARR